jgi:predicted enzyme related to lactoylglutathione lyase
MNSPLFFEFQSDDLSRAREFYGRVFGWTFNKVDGLPVEYWEIETEGIRGGLLARPVPRANPQMGTNAATISMEVESFDKTAAIIAEYGGQVAMEKFAIPGRCWQGYFIDPDGNVFGIFEVDEEAQ